MVLPRFPQTRPAFVTLLLVVLALSFGGCRSTPDSVTDVPDVRDVPEESARVATPTVLERPPDNLTTPHLEYRFDGTGLSGSIELQITFADVEDPTFGTTQRVTAAVEGMPPVVRVVPSLAGLVNGRLYRVTIAPAADLTALWYEHTLRITIELSVVEPRFPADDSWYFDRRVGFYWRVDHDHRSEIALALNPGGDAYSARPWRRPATATLPARVTVWTPDDPLPGERVRWWVRAVHPSGVLGDWIDGGSFRVGYAPAPQSELGPVHLSPLERPTLRWSQTPGAVAWEVELISAPGPERPELEQAPGDDGAAQDGAAPVEHETREPWLQLDVATLERLAMAADGRLYYRVRARNSQGEKSAWSDWNEFQHRPLGITMRRVLAPSRSAVVRVGTAQAQLTRPFAMARTETTTEVVVFLGNLALERQVAYLAAGGLYERATDRLLLGLETLTSGHQFSIRLEDGELAVVEGYEAHPAVGVTWYGAVAMANALSWLEGYDARFAGSEPRSPDLPGYRLPSEAEWSLAAAAGYPGTVTPVAAHSARVNHFRSGDLFEDPVEPYTRNGGPTTPVGFFNNASQHGIVDLVGNVWEWCSDWYDTAPERYIGDAPNPSGAPAGVPDIYGDVGRVVRGAGWNTRLPQIGAAARGWFPPDAAGFSIGVRFVRTEAR